MPPRKRTTARHHHGARGAGFFDDFIKPIVSTVSRPALSWATSKVLPPSVASVANKAGDIGLKLAGLGIHSHTRAPKAHARKAVKAAVRTAAVTAYAAGKRAGARSGGSFMAAGGGRRRR